MQTSMVFSQRRWPGFGGDLDDCWAVASIQAVNVTSPWLRLVGISAFRKAAGNPDDPTKADGGDTAQIVRGIRGCYPALADHLRVLRGGTWSALLAHAAAGRPATIAIDSSKLPADLRFGFTGRHQVCVAQLPSGAVMLANPLAQPYARWLKVSWDALRPAITGYGRIRSGTPGVWAVVLPDDAEALTLWHADSTPYDQADIDAATVELQARIDAAKEALG